MTAGIDREMSYHCVVGHDVPAAQLEALTAEWELDAGARVRVCVEHGTPIAITQSPIPTEAQPG